MENNARTGAKTECRLGKSSGNIMGDGLANAGGGYCCFQGPDCNGVVRDEIVQDFGTGGSVVGGDGAACIPEGIQSNVGAENYEPKGSKKSSVARNGLKSNVSSGADDVLEQREGKGARTENGVSKESDVAAKRCSSAVPRSNANDPNCRRGQKEIVPWRFQVGYKRSFSAFCSNGGSPKTPEYRAQGSSTQCTPGTRSTVRCYATPLSNVRVSAVRDFSSRKVAMDKISAPFFSGTSPAAASVAGVDEDDRLCFQAQELMFAYNISMVLRAAIQLGLLDALSAAGGKALTPNELVENVETSSNKAEAAAAVDRILRYLSCFNVVTCSSEAAGPDGTLVRRYTTGPLCRWLTKDRGDGTLSPFAVFVVDPDHLFPWHHIAEAVTAGGPSAFERTQKWPYYEYMGKNQRLGTLFDNAMAQHSVILVTKMLERFKGFDGVQRLVDVGGGTGSTLGMITSKYKHMTGINYDLPHVIAQGLPLPGVEHVAGDMYESIPTGDAVLLQWITLMLNDDEFVKILSNCHNALPKDGKVIVVDGILPENPDSSLTARDAFTLDIIMFVLFKGAKQRTEKEFARLAKQAGFTGGIKKTYIFFNFYALEFTK
ncbi:hypothetical protein ZWY2020_059122 [Hordeum vulgare]|nr:hypothetical protein ZWY2020_059122 [Hordeum vulgare]